MTKIAISTGVYYLARETQINNHIENIFGGSAVVLASKKGADPKCDRPHLIWDNANTFDSSMNTIRALANYRKTGSLKVPFGTTRRNIIDFLRGNNVKAVLSEFGTDAARLAPVTEEAGIPLFAYFRGADATSYLRRPSRVALYKRMFPKMRGVISVSRFLFDVMASQGITHSNSFVIPSGVDTIAFKPSRKTPFSCLAVGRFIEKKRPDITIRAFAKASGNVPDAKLEMIGDGPLLAQCKALAKDIGADKKIVFHGLKPHDFVRDRMANSEIFLQHSVTDQNGATEGLPTSIQEAMASGMVTLSTRHAGIPDAVIEGETGLLSDERDETDFAALLSDLLGRTETLRRMAAQARRNAVDQFERSMLLRKTEATIDSLI